MQARVTFKEDAVAGTGCEIIECDRWSMPTHSGTLILQVGGFGHKTILLPMSEIARVDFVE